MLETIKNIKNIKDKKELFKNPLDIHIGYYFGKTYFKAVYQDKIADHYKYIGITVNVDIRKYITDKLNKGKFTVVVPKDKRSKLKLIIK